MRRSSAIASALLGVAFGAVTLCAHVPAASAQVDDDDTAAGAPGSKTFERAIDLYRKKDYYSSTIELNKVLAGDTGDDDAIKQRAEFYMGKTLYKMGYYASAQSWFEKIVGAGPDHGYYPATLKWLAALSRVLPETSGILTLIGKYDPSALDQPIMDTVRDELYFLLGRHFYNIAEFDKAIELFNKVSESSEFYVKAKFFEGVTHVRKYDGRPAGEAFKRVLEVSRERPQQYKAADLDRYEELAILQMARVFYSTKDFDKAIRYYEKLEQNSRDWAESLFEASWAYFMKTNNPKALGNIHTLNAPYFENQFFPESILLKSVIYYKYCAYDRALEAVSEFNQKYKPLRANLQGVVDKYEDNAEFYDYVKKIKAGKAGLDDTTQRLTMSVLDDKTLAKTFAWVDELDHELAMLGKADKAWQTTAVAGDISADLELVKSVAATNAGKLAKERLQRLLKELGDLSRDGTKIRIEVLDAQAGKVSAERTGSDAKISKDRKEDPIVVDDEHFVWRFNGEYWKDELGYYRFKVRSQCPK